MTAPVFEETRNDHTIKIYHDEDAENPRDYDNIGTLICGHSRYTLGDKHSFDGGREFLLDQLELDEDCELNVDQLFKRAQKHAILLPVYLYDHSGLVMNTTGFHCPWDSGQVGFINVTLEKARSEYSVTRVSAKLRTKVAGVLTQEVTTYSDYISGNVYGYVVEKDDEEVDSCWGFIGDYEGYCLDEARSSVPIAT
jgi:hypothetical protein